jgi:hypothetical protein
MLINLSIQNVDSYADIVLGKQSDLHFKRWESASPEKIVYSITLLKFKKHKFKITLHKMDEYLTEITFPVRIPYYDLVARSPSPGVGLIAASRDHVPASFKNKAEETKYRVCNALWLQLNLKKRSLSQGSSKSIVDGQGRLPPKVKKSGKVYLRNKALWKELRFFYRSSEYKTAKQGIDHMRKKHPKFKMSEKTMDKIIKAGLSGEYD